MREGRNRFMSITLRIILGLAALLLAGSVCWQVNSHKLLLRYSLIWFFVSLVVILAAIFPDAVFWLSSSLGFDVSSNFVFLVAIIFLLLSSISLTGIASRQQKTIKNLVQDVALLEDRLEKVENNLHSMP